MARLSKKRRSFVKTLKDWPRGTRRRGWGFLHDQVWFPASFNRVSDIFGERVPNRPGHIVIERIDGEWHELYLDRKMFWWPLGTLRIHTFHMGDDDAAPHDHPWWFITFPLRSYTETVQTGLSPSVYHNSRVVRAWRFHFRSAYHRHFVHEPIRPFTTLLITGRNVNNWSFFPRGKRVLHREWTNYNREAEE